MNLLQILLAIFSTMSLLSLSVYIYLWTKGNSCVLCNTGNFSLPLKQNIFLLSACLGFLVCMFKGVETMLFWIPHEIGVFDSDGDYTSLKVHLAGLFTLGSLAFVGEIERSARDRIALKLHQERSIEIDNYLEAYSNVDRLKYLKRKYANTFEKIEESQEIGLVDMLLDCRSSPEYLRKQIYKDLLSRIEERLDNINNARST